MNIIIHARILPRHSKCTLPDSSAFHKIIDWWAIITIKEIGGHQLQILPVVLPVVFVEDSLYLILHLELLEEVIKVHHNGKQPP